jgi:acylphosphatase
MATACQIRVLGRVQGVGYRYACREHARALGVTGWVRNDPDGRSVTIHAEGLPESVDSLIAWCREAPPVGARVQSVQVSPAAPLDAQTFDVRF